MNIDKIKEIDDVIKKMIIAAAPERESELNELWEEYSPQFCLREDSIGFSMAMPLS